MPNSGRIRGFSLRKQSQAEGQRYDTDIQTLYDIFGACFDSGTIRRVYESLGASLDGSINALVEMDGMQSESERCPNFQAEQSMLDLIPLDCLSMILEYLSPIDMAKIAPTCRTFADFAKKQRNRTSITVPAGLSPAAVRGLISSFALCDTLDVSRMARDNSFIYNPEDYCQAIASGELDRGDHGTKVQSLKCHRASAFDNHILSTMMQKLKGLRSISISGCPKIDDDICVVLSRYRTFSTGPRSSFENPCGSTTGSSTSNSWSLGDAIESPGDAVRRIAIGQASSSTRQMFTTESSGSLQHLSLDGSSISSKGVSKLLKGNVRLSDLLSLDISRCKSVTGECLMPGVGSTLRSLVSNGCCSIKKVNLQLDSKSHLENIQMCNCQNLREVNIRSSSLQTLNLSGCSQMERLSVQAVKLETLKLSGCKKMHEQLLDCPNLKTLNLFGCRAMVNHSMEDILISMKNLRCINISGCNLLTRFRYEFGCEEHGMLDALGCSNLRSLEIRCMEKALDQVILIGCSQLRVRYFISCYQLLQFVFADPMFFFLQNLSIEGCKPKKITR
jgi:hypothetical protein